ncbi:MAG: undecaprenyl-diphosphate phosphatase [Planctomycetota bacterium]
MDVPGQGAVIPQDQGPGLSLLDAAWLGLVEGLTEFLPVSSTGHLIVANRLLGLKDSPLTIGIQLGAITAILVLYWDRLWQAMLGIVRRGPAADERSSPNLLFQIVVAAVPAATLGLLLDDWIEEQLFSAEFVAVTMAAGGVLLLWLERVLAQRAVATGDIAAMSYRTAFWIGCFQCLALLPGTSRSGATIAGALLLGMSRTAAAEFSFLIGLPILYGACAVKLLKEWELVSGPLLEPMLVGTGVAFVSALAVVKPFVAFLRNHTFVPFAIYRLLAGALLAIGCWSMWV